MRACKSIRRVGPILDDTTDASRDTTPTPPACDGLRITIAAGFWRRFRGWMLKRSAARDEALLLTRCACVHTCFMRFPIDVVYLDARGVVLKVVRAMPSWRWSAGAGAAHVLELAADGAERCGLEPGATLILPPGVARSLGHRTAFARRQGGSAMVEFTVIGPVLTLIGMAILQYVLLFNARNLVNEAAFMAGRAGSMGHAMIGTVQEAFIKALIPLYGGGTNSAELAQSYARAMADTAGYLQVQILNPTKESYDKWSVDALKARYGARAIPNSGLAFRNPDDVDPISGQNIQDANLLKLRITYGYVPKVPLIGAVVTSALKWADTGTDAFHSTLVNAGRVPVTTDLTIAMQSDPVEGPTVSIPASGTTEGGERGGASDDKGSRAMDGKDSPPDHADPSDGGPAPTNDANDTGASDNSGGEGCGPGGCTNSPPSSPGGESQPPLMCPARTATTTSTVPSDVLFAFGQATLTAEGKTLLDQAIAEAKTDTTLASVTLTGHTDQIGNARDNLSLSLGRATAVRDYLQANGFPAVPIAVKGAGDAEPKKALADCPASGQPQIDCLAANRRVDISITRRSP